MTAAFQDDSVMARACAGCSIALFFGNNTFYLFYAGGCTFVCYYTKCKNAKKSAEFHFRRQESSDSEQ